MQKIKKGAKVFLYKVTKPELYGVAKIGKKNKIIKIVEKPKNIFLIMQLLEFISLITRLMIMQKN